MLTPISLRARRVSRTWPLVCATLSVAPDLESCFGPSIAWRRGERLMNDGRVGSGPTPERPKRCGVDPHAVECTIDHTSFNGDADPNLPARAARVEDVAARLRDPVCRAGP